MVSQACNVDQEARRPSRMAHVGMSRQQYAESMAGVHRQKSAAHADLASTYQKLAEALKRDPSPDAHREIAKLEADIRTYDGRI